MFSIKKYRNRTMLILILILAIGTVLRVESVLREPYPIGDEKTYLYVVGSLDKNLTIPMKLAGGEEVPFIDHPTFTIYIGYFFTKIFGFSIISLRFIMVIFGVASIIVCYVLARKFFSREVALLASLLLSISPMVISNNSSYWIHSPLELLLLLCAYFLFAYVNKGAPKSLFLSALFLGMSIGTSYLAATFILPSLAVLAYYKKIRINKIDRNVLLAMIPMLAGIVVAFPQVLDVNHLFLSIKEQLGHAVVLGALSNPGSTFLGVPYDAMPLYYYPVLLLFKLNFLFPLFIYSFYKLYRGSKKDIILLILLCLPLLQLSLMKIKMARYIIFLMPFIYIGVSKVVSENKRIAVWFLVGFALFTAWEIYDVHPYYELTGYYAGLSFSDVGAFRCQSDWKFDETVKQLNNTLSASFCEFTTEYKYNGSIPAGARYVVTDVAFEKVKDGYISAFLKKCEVVETYSIKVPFYFLYKC